MNAFYLIQVFSVPGDGGTVRYPRKFQPFNKTWEYMSRPEPNGFPGASRAVDGGTPSNVKHTVGTRLSANKVGMP